MPLSLFQPTFNATIFQNYYHLDAVPSRYPEPVSPDTYDCAEFYARPSPATTQDCQIALGLLPSGTADEPFSYHFNNDDPNLLPLRVSHGKYLHSRRRTDYCSPLGKQ